MRFRVTNNLGEATSLHWHGMHLPPSMDGGPHQMITAGATWSPTWTIRQQAASLWYHPHPHGRTASHLYRGIAGMFLVDDDTAPGLRLPCTYGVDDIPLIVQDRRLPGGVLDPNEPMAGTTGFLGDRVLVNGTLGPYLRVTAERIRLRLLNGCNARVFRFHFADRRAFAQIASDGGLLPAPHLTDNVQLSAGSATAHRTFLLAEHMINGRRMSMDRVDLTVAKETTEMTSGVSPSTTT